jgi:hypothetical protein
MSVKTICLIVLALAALIGSTGKLAGYAGGLKRKQKSRFTDAA